MRAIFARNSNYRVKARATLTAAALLLTSVAASRGDDVDQFYRGRVVTLIVGYSAGGGYDIYARTLARHMADHIPGKPTIVVQNMPGAGSIVSANYLFNVAPRDGSVFGIFGRGVPMEPLIGSGNARYDANKFTWIGSAADELSVCAVTKNSKVKSWDDLMTTDISVGGEGSGSDPDTYSMLIKGLFGAHLKIVTGYPGGNDMTLAVERGELDGRCGWSWGSIRATRPDWVSGPNRLNILAVISTHRSAELPDVMTVLERAKTDHDRDIIRLVVSRQELARPFAAPPGVPVARANILRKAFMETMSDPAYVSEAKTLGLDVTPVSGESVETLISNLYKTPAPFVAETRAIIAAGASH